MTARRVETLMCLSGAGGGCQQGLHKWEGAARSGLLSTAGNLLFSAGPGNSMVALNATTGDALWHTRLNTAISNGPITYEIDGLQYVIVGASDMLWAFVMNK